MPNLETINIGGQTYTLGGTIDKIAVDGTVYDLPSGGGGGDELFIHYLNNTLTDITIPSSVTSLHNYVFSHLTNLKTIDLGNVVRIGHHAFEYTGLTSIVFPGSVTNVEGTLFYETPIETVVFEGPVTLGSEGGTFNSKSIKKITFKGDVNFSNRDQYSNGTLENIISAGPLGTGYDLEFTNVDVISHLFDNLRFLETCEVNSQCTRVESYGIYGNRRIKTLEFPSTLTSIANNNFQYMDCMEYVKLNSSTPPAWNQITASSFFDIVVPDEYLETYRTSLSAAANRIFAETGYAHDYSVTELRYSNQTGTTSFTTLSDTSLSTSNVSRSNLKRVYIGQNVTEIGNSTFYGSYEVFIPDNNSIQILNPSSFYMTYAKTFNFPNVTTIVGSSSYNPYSYTTPVFSNNLVNVGSYAFSNIQKLQDFVLPDSVTQLNGYTFYSTNVYGTLTLGSGLTTIGNNDFSFASASDISEIIVRSTTVPASMFRDKNYSKTIPLLTLGSTVTGISDRAFENFRVGKIVVGRNVASVGYHSLYSSWVDTIVFLGATPPTFDTTTAAFYSSIQHIYVPASAVEAYKTALPSFVSVIEANPEDNQESHSG